MNPLDLTGRTALVIRAGGALGRAGARMLAERVARVVVTDGDGEALEAGFGHDDRFTLRTACACDADALGGAAFGGVEHMGAEVAVVLRHRPAFRCGWNDRPGWGRLTPGGKARF